MIRGKGWQSDCPQCVGSKFTCDKHYQPDEPEIECPDCEGEGETEHPFLEGSYTHSHAINPPSSVMITCEACNGKGWRPMTDDEIDDAAADAFSDMCCSEPPITMQERHEAAWKQKMELK